MKGYAKIKENNPFSQKLKSNTEYPFLDHDFNGHLDSKSPNKITQKNEEKPNIIIENGNSKVKDDLCLGKSEEKWDRESALEEKNEGESKIGSVLRRNFSSKTTFGYQKNGKSNNLFNESGNKSNNLERQSSKRVVIQETVKRAFSMRRCSSVNNHGNSDRYSRIYDQPIINNDDYDYVHDYGDNGKTSDDDFGRNGSMETRSKGHKNVGSKVFRACKRLFSR